MNLYENYDSSRFTDQSLLEITPTYNTSSKLEFNGLVSKDL